MTETPPLIGYASGGSALPADRLLRRIVGWSAIAYGGQAVVSAALQVALAAGWAASPPQNTGWALGSGWGAAVTVGQRMASAALLAGGVLMLRRSPAGVLVLRAGGACSAALAVVGVARLMWPLPVYASTPATATIYALAFSQGLWPPALIVLLTLPPLAKRMG